MKDEYEKLCCKIEEAVQKLAVPCDLGSEFEVFSNVEPRNHPTIIKSDPMVVVFAKKKDSKLEELGRTEVILNSLNPVWINKVTIAYQFEILQPLVFYVFDVDTKYHIIPVQMLNLKDQDFLGEANCVLSEIVTKHSQSLTLNLQGKTVHAEETVASRSAVEIVFRCSNLTNTDLFSKSDPFLRISRVVESGGFVPICKTEAIDNNLNPIWKPLCLSMQQFGSKDNPFIIECFDFNANGNHVLIGKIQKSVADLEKLYIENIGANFVFPSSHRGPDKVLKGQLYVDRFLEKEQFSFVDYISSGFELNFMVAVDFTASNGDRRNPDSLHSIDPFGRLNSYQQFLRKRKRKMMMMMMMKRMGLMKYNGMIIQFFYYAVLLSWRLF